MIDFGKYMCSSEECDFCSQVQRFMHINEGKYVPVQSKSPPASLSHGSMASGPSSQPEGKSSRKDSESSFVRFPTESRNHGGLY